jgi:hypothetical protein
MEVHDHLMASTAQQAPARPVSDRLARACHRFGCIRAATVGSSRPGGVAPLLVNSESCVTDGPKLNRLSIGL